MDRLEQLFAWAKQNGCHVNEKLQFSYGDCGYIATATEPIAEKEVLVSCPEAVMIGPSLAKQFDPAPDMLQSAIKLSLVKEQHLGKESRFFAFINCLPTVEQMNMACYFSPDDLEYIRDTNVGADVPIRTQRFKDEFEKAVKELKLDSSYTFDDYHWACNVFSSRAFPARLVYPELEDVAILLPIVDLLNHKPREQINWSGNGDRFEMTTGRQVQSGEELFNNYGAKGNEELLLSYGFCIKDNPADSVCLKLGEPHPRIIEAVKEFPANRMFYLTHYDPMPELLVEVFRETSKIQDGYTNDRVAIAAGLEMLKPALMAKCSQLVKKLDQLAKPTNYRQACAVTCLEGQVSVYKDTLAALKQQVEQVRSEFTPLDLSAAADIKCDPSKFGAQTIDELIDMGQEETCIIAHLCQNCDLTGFEGHDAALYEELQKGLRNTGIEIPAELLAKAGSVLRQRGYIYYDDKARERFCVLWGKAIPKN